MLITCQEHARVPSATYDRQVQTDIANGKHRILQKQASAIGHILRYIWGIQYQDIALCRPLVVL